MAGKVGKGMSPNSEPNVIPFIDIMLVLLIIFMIAAPISSVDIEVAMPDARIQPSQRIFLFSAAARHLALSTCAGVNSLSTCTTPSLASSLPASAARYNHCSAASLSCATPSPMCNMIAN